MLITVGIVSQDVKTILNTIDAVKTNVTGTDIAFVAGNEITSGATDLSVFNDGDQFAVTGTASNNGTYTVIGTPTATSIVTVQTTAFEAAGASVTLDATGIADTQSYSDFKSMKEGNEYNITIQNLGATDVFLEKTTDATEEGGMKIAATGGEYKFSTRYPEKFNLISGTANEDVRITST